MRRPHKRFAVISRRSRTASQVRGGQTPKFAGILPGPRMGAAIERAVVVTLTVASVGLVPFMVAGFGETEQTAAFGAPVQVSEMF